jgi:hypothetical protein
VIRNLFDDAHKALWRLVCLNNAKGPGARYGAMLDGDVGNGKTTSATQFGRLYERRCRERYPQELTPEGHEYLPVAYATAESFPTVKGLNRALLRFYGLRPKRADTSELTDLVLRTVRLCGTSLIIIDDIHCLELHREADRGANNHLKRLANDARATFLYAGVGLEHTGFLRAGDSPRDAQLAQISQRFTRIPVSAMQRSREHDKKLFLGVLSFYERELVLLGARAGDLTGIADYLWRRTHGVIGALSQMLCCGCIESIQTGSERITKKLLDEIDIGYPAEVQSGRHTPRRAAA